MTEGLQIGLSREAWGPRFWKILHTLAECSGQQKTSVQSNDEADAWSFLIKAQAFVMPCALCKQHFLEFQKRNPIGNLRTLQGEGRKQRIRSWLWECHKRVNELNNKQSPSLQQLLELYPKQSIEKEVREIVTMFQLAHTLQHLKPEDTHRWRQYLARLRILYGI